MSRCLDCGQMKRPYRRVDGGTICDWCDRLRGRRTAACNGCSDTAALVKGLCERCRLRQRVAELAAAAEPGTAATLAPFLTSMADAPNPASTLRWMYTPAFEITRKLLAGDLPITHAGLDQQALDTPKPVAFLRAALVNSGTLQTRDEPSAIFALWHQHAINRIAVGPDRAHVRAYATWHVAHRLARTSQQGRATPASQKYARALISEAIKLVCWLHDQQLELDELRQDIVDRWVADGATSRRRVRLFLAWLERADVTGPLEVAWNDHAPRGPLPDDPTRFAMLRRLLHDDAIDLRDRLGGCLLLLYAQPLTRTVALKIRDVTLNDNGQTTIRLGRGPVQLPEPLASIALALHDEHPETDDHEGWLLPGRYAGTHISADHLRQRLRRYGIDRSRESRQAALLALAARLPAPILAERIGIHPTRAVQWTRLAGATYAEYVATRTAATPTTP